MSEPDTPPFNRNRIGKFRISTPTIEDARRDINSRSSKTLAVVMAHMIVVRAELLFEFNAIEYTAISKLFAPLQDCSAAPMYTIRLQLSEDEEQRVKVIAELQP